jgi:hypothetical protein
LDESFHSLINEHPLLASYSNILVIVSPSFDNYSLQMYWSLKVLESLTHEVTYSWRVYVKLIEAIVAKIIRDLSMK